VQFSATLRESTPRISKVAKLGTDEPKTRCSLRARVYRRAEPREPIAGRSGLCAPPLAPSRSDRISGQSKRGPIQPRGT